MVGKSNTAFNGTYRGLDRVYLFSLEEKGRCETLDNLIVYLSVLTVHFGP